MDMGEEARNNRAFGDFGYGHVLFLNIPRAVSPAPPTGLLAKAKNAPGFSHSLHVVRRNRRMGALPCGATTGRALKRL